ncbi:hypothetical protein, partial [Chondromyces apiculatus]|uniref:hypothetical protein n=1 Tax=Chondromyces apiculatus TaxID=51 RepID=UPI0005C488CC
MPLFISILVTHEDQHFTACLVGLESEAQDITRLRLETILGAVLPDPLPLTGVHHIVLAVLACLSRLVEKGLDHTHRNRCTDPTFG